MKRQLLNLLAILAAFGINIWSNLAPANGVTIGEISNTVYQDVLITPANYAFAIWGMIYLSLISFAIYQALPSQRHNPYLEQIGYLLVASSVAQIAWVFLFQYQFVFSSLVAMILILVPLLTIYLRLGIAYTEVSRTNRRLIHFPISIYFAWISVATIVNFALTLYKFEWSGWGISPFVWTVVMLVIATIIAIAANLLREDTTFLLVVLWALIAIAVRHVNILPLVTVAGGLAIILLILLLLRILNSRSI